MTVHQKWLLAICAMFFTFCTAAAVSYNLGPKAVIFRPDQMRCEFRP